jgi:hypothetical protein
MEFDEYRVNLFKKKLRAELPEVDGLRFYRSKGRCHLILVAIRYNDPEGFTQYVSDRLKRAGISFSENKWWDGVRTHSLSIPIDQEALPERRRRIRHQTK